MTRYRSAHHLMMGRYTVTIATFIRSTLAVLLLSMAVTACGDPEVKQREQFKDFLQTQLLNKQGADLPRSSQKQKDSFGPYADHYEIIAAFHAEMNDVMIKAEASILSIARKAPPSFEEVMGMREAYADLRKKFATVLSALNDAQATADRAKEGITQPDDLESIYNAAYDKFITTPANASRDAFSAFDEALVIAERLAVLLHENRDRLEISGDVIETEDDDLLAKIDAELDAGETAMHSAHQALRQLQDLISSR